MKTAIIVLILIQSCWLTVTKTSAQGAMPEAWGLRGYEITDKTCGRIRFYIDTVGIANKAPLLLDVNGSGHLPNVLCIESKGALSYMCTFLSPLMEMSQERYHYVLLDKPDVPFADTVALETDDIYSAMGNYAPSQGYEEKLSLYWRANAYKAVIRHLIKKGMYDGSKIVAFGTSEGGQVAPYLAVQCPQITHLVSWMGGGLNQFFDEMTAWRLRALKGECSHEAAQAQIDTLLQTYADIYAHPTATEKRYWGHTYKRWASFCAQDPLSYLVQLDIPILLVSGSADSNSPIFGLDYVPLDFLRRGKKNLTYWVCAGCDHSLDIIENIPEGEAGESQFMQFMEKTLDWLENQP